MHLPLRDQLLLWASFFLVVGVVTWYFYIRMPNSALKHFNNVSHFVHPGAALIRLWVGEADHNSNVVSLAILSGHTLVCVLNSFSSPF